MTDQALDQMEDRCQGIVLLQLVVLPVLPVICTGTILRIIGMDHRNLEEVVVDLLLTEVEETIRRTEDNIQEEEVAAAGAAVEADTILAHHRGQVVAVAAAAAAVRVR